MTLPDYDHPKDKPEGYVFGRPTSYKAEYCEQVVNLGREGKSKVQIAATLGVMKNTLDNWAAVHPDFLTSLTHARELAQAWWEDSGQSGMREQTFHASLWAKQVSCRFPDDYREVTRQELTGKDGQPIRVKREASDFSDEELAAIAAGSGPRTPSEA